MYCQNCGKKLEEWYAFCPACGCKPGDVQGRGEEFSLFGAYARFWKKYAVFGGRARRQEYWYVYLAQCVILFFALFAMFVPFIVTTFTEGEPSEESLLVILLVTVAVMLYALITMIPNLAIMVRRLHDTGRSGWFYLLNFIPYVGSIVMIVLLAQDSQPGENQYGPNPKY